MATGQDATYSGQTKVYLKQQPAGTLLNGNTITTEEVTDVGGLQSQFGLAAFNGQILPGKISFTISQGATTVCQIVVQVLDNAGTAITQTDGKTPSVFDLDVVLANANGTVTSLTPSTGMAVTVGTLFSTYVAAKAFYVQTNGSGSLTVTITDTGKQGFYLMVQGGTQPVPSISRQLVTGDYGP